MMSLKTVEEQLKKIGCNFRFFNRAEVRELSHILLDSETIAQCIGGQYEGGYALLCATNSRILLVDKKPKYLTLKDIRYDMITELDFSRRLMNSTINVFTPNKTLRFTGYNQYRMRQLFHHAQEKVMESRMHFMNQGQMHTPGVPDMMGSQPAAIAAFLAANAVGAEPATASVIPEPVFVPNQARSANQVANSYSEHIPIDPPTTPTPPPVTERSATAYANMPLIMNGWRRRVYGYHVNRAPEPTPPSP